MEEEENKDMKDIKRVVIPVDKSDASRAATEKGAQLAKALGIDVVVISVDDSTSFIVSPVLEEKIMREHKTFLEEFKQIAASKDIPVHTEVIKGMNPAEEIIKFTNEDDLIVMASHNRKGLDKFILGSVSEEVLKFASCPVMIVKPHLIKNQNLLTV